MFGLNVYILPHYERKKKLVTGERSVLLNKDLVTKVILFFLVSTEFTHYSFYEAQICDSVNID